MREESRKLLDKGRRALKAAETLNTTVGSWMLSMSGSRGDYDFQTSFDTESVAVWIGQAREFWEVAQRLLDEGHVTGRD